MEICNTGIGAAEFWNFIFLKSIGGIFWPIENPIKKVYVHCSLYLNVVYTVAKKKSLRKNLKYKIEIKVIVKLWKKRKTLKAFGRILNKTHLSLQRWFKHTNKEKIRPKENRNIYWERSKIVKCTIKVHYYV